MFIAGRKSKTRAVKDGRRERRKCPDCEKTAVFIESERDSKYHVFFVEVLRDEDRVWVCSECGEAMDLEDTEAPELSPAERARQAKERERLAKEEAEAREQAAKARESQKRREAQQIDSELEALKKQLLKK